MKGIGMVIFTLRLEVAPNDRLNILKAIHAIIGPTAVLKGCLHCGLYSNSQNDDELILLEKWKSQQDLERHIRSDDFHKILTVMEAAKKKPEISFYSVASKAGLELVKKIRSG
ncbi:MAG: antibiotic biosynthesis monooxygenase [Deltaproteobacteria bacterium]|nr:antibiotic biosynthesis monooxygenase [Deltaproteobacteria bacterium]MBW2201553.1 antibiotic biosynthesis monooxygenase [Deltaproteobacteria bacterium]